MDLQVLEEILGYIEEHLKDELDLGELAGRAYCSPYHFQRTFGILCGLGPGEYIRRRRLSRAALDLKRGAKVLDVALDYGYTTGESFSRAFYKFHGVMPAQAKRGAAVKNYPRMEVRKEGTREFGLRIEELPAKTLVGFKRRFHGAPCGEERARQEHSFYESTRGKQWLLFGAGGGKAEEYALLMNITEEGYDYYIAYALDDSARGSLSDPAVLGIGGDLGFETVLFGSCRAAVFATEKSVHPIADYFALRASLENLMERADFEFADAPELVVYHWHLQQKEERYIEICLPIK